MRKLKYAAAFTLPAIAFISLNQTGWLSFLAILYGFGLIPLLELLIAPKSENMQAAEEEVVKEDRFFDFLIYLIVHVQYALLAFFLYRVNQTTDTITLVGYIFSFGLMCGVLGINVAHELGHRAKKSEQNMAKALLLTSLYLHFFIEHNRGHHKNVSTQEDPATSRYNEPIYLFWPRSIIFGFISAWQLEAKRLKAKSISAFSLKNEMLQFQLIQATTLVVIGFTLGILPLIAFLGSALFGILLLETVNYIEHYGLSRQLQPSGLYERVKSTHSWNSNHILGRMMLFELSRHSDHHYIASRKYQILRHHDESPQMPTGYPGMMLLSLVPPLLFSVMNPKISASGEGILSPSAE